MRILLALALSLVLHGLLVVHARWATLLPLPRSPITVEILPARKTAPPPLTPSAPVPRKEAPGKPAGKPTGTVASHTPRPTPKPATAKQPPPPRPEDLKALGTEDASVVVLLRMPALRHSPHRPAIEGLLSAFPDARILAAGTSFSAPGTLPTFLLDTLQALVITTADPRDLTATVLLAVPGPDPIDLKDRLAGRKSFSFDSRELSQLTQGLLVFARPDLVRGWLKPEWAVQMQALATAQGPALRAEVRNLDRLLVVQDGLPTPQLVQVSISAEARPRVVLHLEMPGEEDAVRAAAALPLMQKQLSQQLTWLGLGHLLSGLQVSRNGKVVEVTGPLPEAETDLLLNGLRLLLPPPPGEVVAPLPPPEESTGQKPDLD